MKKKIFKATTLVFLWIIIVKYCILMSGFLGHKKLIMEKFWTEKEDKPTKLAEQCNINKNFNNSIIQDG